jgi:hypothetical protein
MCKLPSRFIKNVKKLFPGFGCLNKERKKERKDFFKKPMSPQDPERQL